MGKVLTMLNQKGGVGKTSTCFHAAGALSAMGRRVLLCDNDPQASLTQGFLGPMGMRALPPEETIAGLYSREAWATGLAIPTGLEGVDLIPGGRSMRKLNMPEPELLDWNLQRSLADGLEPILDDYDLIIIDCPPNLELCSWAALVASDFLIVPLKPEDFGAQGIAEVASSLDQLRADIRPEIVHLGYLLTMVVARRTVHRAYESQLREMYGPLVFEARMAESVEYVDALAARKTVQQMKPKGAAAKAMRAIVEEIESRIGQAAGGVKQEAA
jgi:chromosome partitioning protein